MGNLRVFEGTCFLGRTLEMEYGNICLSVTLDVGPRIISLRHKLGENIMFNDTKDEINKDVSKVFGAGKKWHIYGGHRIWASPESENTYIPDNQEVKYIVDGDSVEFIPKVWPVVLLQSNLKITFISDNSIEVGMTLKNTSKIEQRISLWALTVLKVGGTMEVKLPTKDTGYLPNRNLVMWPYASINDDRFTFRDNVIKVKSNNLSKSPFKLGVFTDAGLVRYEIGKDIFEKKIETLEGEFPDMNCNVETYFSNLIHEVETLSPFKTLLPSDSITHKETWTLRRKE